MYELVRGDPIFFAIMQVAVRILGAAIGALVAAPLLVLAARLVAGIKPGYWRSYRALFYAGAITIVIHYVIAWASPNQSLATWKIAVVVLIALFVQYLFYRPLMERTIKDDTGWLPPATVSLALTLLGIMGYIGIAALERKLAAGGGSFFLPPLERLFSLGKVAGMNRTSLLVAAAGVFLLTHFLLLLRKTAEPSWLGSGVLAGSLIPFGLGFMLIANQLYGAIGQPVPAPLFAAARQASFWTGFTVLLVLVSGRLSLHFRRHRLLAAMQMGPAVPSYFWVVLLPLLAICASSFGQFLLEWSFLRSASGNAHVLVTSATVVRILVIMHFLGLFTALVGAILVAVAHWRAGKGLGKAPWTLLALIYILLLLSGGTIFLSIYRYGVFQAL